MRERVRSEDACGKSTVTLAGSVRYLWVCHAAFHAPHANEKLTSNMGPLAG